MRVCLDGLHSEYKEGLTIAWPGSQWHHLQCPSLSSILPLRETEQHWSLLSEQTQALKTKSQFVYQLTDSDSTGLGWKIGLSSKFPGVATFAGQEPHFIKHWWWFSTEKGKRAQILRSNLTAWVPKTDAELFVSCPIYSLKVKCDLDARYCVRQHTQTFPHGNWKYPSVFFTPSSHSALTWRASLQKPESPVLLQAPSEVHAIFSNNRSTVSCGRKHNWMATRFWAGLELCESFCKLKAKLAILGFLTALWSVKKNHISLARFYEFLSWVRGETVPVKMEKRSHMWPQPWQPDLRPSEFWNWTVSPKSLSLLCKHPGAYACTWDTSHHSWLSYLQLTGPTKSSYSSLQKCFSLESDPLPSRHELAWVWVHEGSWGIICFLPVMYQVFNHVRDTDSIFFFYSL